jgi:hypothetical protein
MRVEQPWLGDLVATASVSGECGLAEIALEVHNRLGEVVWSANYPSVDLFGFDDIVEIDAMRIAVDDWLVSYADSSSSARLPEWPQGAEQPDAGEFPFYVEDFITQPDYEDIRSADIPMICYIQGRESTRCLVKFVGDSGGSELLSMGAQSFPG